MRSRAGVGKNWSRKEHNERFRNRERQPDVNWNSPFAGVDYNWYKMLRLKHPVLQGRVAFSVELWKALSVERRERILEHFERTGELIIVVGEGRHHVFSLEYCGLGREIPNGGLELNPCSANETQRLQKELGLMLEEVGDADGYVYDNSTREQSLAASQGFRFCLALR